MSINQVCISGNLGHDPELRSTQSGTQVCKLAVCVNERVKSGGEWKDRPNWVDVTFFGNRAEAIAKNLSKGSLVMVSGRLHQSTWEKDGRKQSRLEVIGSDIQFGSKAKPKGQQDEPDQEQDVYDEDIPF